MGASKDDAPAQGDLWRDFAPRRAREREAEAQPEPRSAPEPPAQRAPEERGGQLEPKPGARQRPLSVRDLIRTAQNILDRSIGTVWVQGETTSVTRPSSGHIYFGLKDGRAQVRCVLWRSDARRLRFQLEDGVRLRCRGRVGLYERDGKFQLYVQHAEPEGLGAAALAFDQLKRKLAGEGLFDAARKRPLPALPRRIGVVTSKSGAAVRDIIRAVERRYPVPILVADAQVQGPTAPRQIANALRAIGGCDVDVVIVGRGGGSASDLSAFDHEWVVRAVAACPVPVISAVGHEVDVSLTDLAADHRAATPTMAGEMAVPVRAQLEAVLVKEERRLHREVALRVRAARQEIDASALGAESRISSVIEGQRRVIGELERRLQRQEPRARLIADRANLRELERRATSSMRKTLDRSHRGFAGLASSLRALSPLRVLERSYAIATRGHHVLRDASEVSSGDRISVRLARGSLDCHVERVHPIEPPSGPISLDLDHDDD